MKAEKVIYVNEFVPFEVRVRFETYSDYDIFLRLLAESPEKYRKTVQPIIDSLMR